MSKRYSFTIHCNVELSKSDDDLEKFPKYLSDEIKETIVENLDTDAAFDVVADNMWNFIVGEVTFTLD